MTVNVTRTTLDQARERVREIEGGVTAVSDGGGGEAGVAKLEELARQALEHGTTRRPLDFLIGELRERVKGDDDPGWQAYALFAALVVRGHIEQMEALLCKAASPAPPPAEEAREALRLARKL